MGMAIGVVWLFCMALLYGYYYIGALWGYLRFWDHRYVVVDDISISFQTVRTVRGKKWMVVWLYGYNTYFTLEG